MSKINNEENKQSFNIENDDDEDNEDETYQDNPCTIKDKQKIQLDLLLFNDDNFDSSDSDNDQ